MPIIAISALFNNTWRALAFKHLIDWRRALLVAALATPPCVLSAYGYTLLTGKGAAMLFHNGKMIKATWHKGKVATSPITLTTKKGNLKVPAGHTWIELVPINGGNVTFTK